MTVIAAPSPPIRIPTKTEAPKPQQVNLVRLSNNDLKSLRKDDAFLFHSIPAFREAALRFRDVDASEMLPAVDGGLRETSATVTRCSRVSTECDVLTLMEDDILGGEGMDNERMDDLFGLLFGVDAANT